MVRETSQIGPVVFRFHTAGQLCRRRRDLIVLE
jgi:hypothetical protein